MENGKLIGKRLIPLNDFAYAISVSVREIYRMIDRNELPSIIKQGKFSFYLKEDLDAYIERIKRQRK